jgi:hypothetical protein
MYLLADGTMCTDKVISCSELAGYKVAVIEQYNGFKTALIETSCNTCVKSSFSFSIDRARKIADETFKQLIKITFQKNKQ